MPRSYDILFATSNRHKYEEARDILAESGISLGRLRYSPAEIQSDDIRKIARAKSEDAFARSKRPVIAEDDGLFIDSLGGFPGPYSSYVFETLGNRGILRLVKDSRAARFEAAISYTYKRDTTVVFHASVAGRISQSMRGAGWGYDPIFVPENSRRTFAQYKRSVSHRYLACRKLVRWISRQL